MSEALRLADALEDTPNWQKESFGSDWKSSTMKFDRTPFEAAAELRRLHAENEALLSETRTLVRQNGQWQALNAELMEALQLVLNNNECLLGERVARAAMAKAQGEMK